MRTSLRAGIALAVALAALLLASVAWATPPGPDTPVVASPAPSTGGPGATCAITNPNCDDTGLGSGDPQVVEPRPGMANVVPTAFDKATVGDDDRTLTITFWSGVEPCTVLDHVDVSYGADAVTVTLFQGSDPDAGPVACIEIAVQKQVTVTLDEPLAGRSIVDGGA